MAESVPLGFCCGSLGIWMVARRPKSSSPPGLVAACSEASASGEGAGSAWSAHPRSASAAPASVQRASFFVRSLLIMVPFRTALHVDFLLAQDQRHLLVLVALTDGREQRIG